MCEQLKVHRASVQIAEHGVVQQKLTAAGTEVSVGTVAAIMAENGWETKQTRAFIRATISDDCAPVFDNILKRDVTGQAPGTKLVGDITYPRTDQGLAESGDRHRSSHPNGHRLVHGPTYEDHADRRRDDDGREPQGNESAKPWAVPLNIRASYYNGAKCSRSSCSRVSR